MQARNKYPDEEFDPGQLDLALAELDDAPYANDNAPETLDDAALAELGLDQLDQVNGGWAGGGYLSAGFNIGGVGATVTLTFGSDGVHLYGSTQAGVGDEAQLSVSGGGWVSNTNSGADYWTQGSSNGSFGLKEGADVSVEGGWNTSGVSGGIQLGLAASPTVFGGNAGVSYGVQLDGAVQAAGDALSGHGNDNPANDTSPGSLADQAGINDIGSHGDNHDGTDHPTDGNDHPTDGNDHPTDGNDHPTDGNDHPTDGTDHPTDGNDGVAHGDGTDHPTDGTDGHTGDSYNGNDYGDHNNDGTGGDHSNDGGGTQVADNGGGGYDGGGGGYDGGGGGDGGDGFA